MLRILYKIQKQKIKSQLST